jgi:hypothetical protein
MVGIKEPSWHKIDTSHPYASWKWNQKYPTDERKSYKCKIGGRVIDHECLIYKQVLPGKYKIGFRYSTIKPENSKLKEVEIVYSNEFMIK